MRLDDRFLDELKSRITLSDLVRRTVPLKRVGREWSGLSPFGKEKTPSFFVHDEKRRWFDFSSGKNGDAIDWLVETERLSFREAAERLAADAGMQVPQDTPADRERETVRRGLQDWLEEAAGWFEAQLRRPAAEPVRAYLERRGLPPEVWPRFRLGYAPGGRTALRDALVDRGATPAVLVEAGLLIAPDDGSAPYDRFRDRLIFPIADARGRVISFGGRAMAAGERAKYLNGPITPVFDKGATVYGLGEARRMVAAGAPLVVVEGYMDVMAVQLADIGAVAPMGTALTEEQLALLWKVSPEPVLCFDGDAAGLRGAYKAVERALPMVGPGRALRFSFLGRGRDPDDVRQAQGLDALRAALGRTRTMAEVLFERERDAAPVDTPEGRAALRQRLIAAAGRVEDEGSAREYRSDLLARFGAFSSAIYQAQRGGRAAPKQGASPRAQELAGDAAGAPDPLRAAAFIWAVDHPTTVAEALEVVGLVTGHAQVDAAMQVVLGAAMDEADVIGALKARGFEAFTATARALAQMAGPPADADAWRATMQAFEHLMRVGERLRGEVDGASYVALRREQQDLERILRTGEVWA